MNVNHVAPGQRRGRFVHGLGQALAGWLTVVLLVLFLRNQAIAWAGCVVAVVSCVLLGQWHQRRGRADTAVGAFSGAVLWPVVIGAALIAINVADQMSGYE
jgi:hypothetical protein